MSIQYLVPGFEPTTLGTLVSSHNHQTILPPVKFLCRTGLGWYLYVMIHCTQLSMSQFKVKMYLFVYLLLLICCLFNFRLCLANSRLIKFKVLAASSSMKFVFYIRLKDDLVLISLSSIKMTN